MCQEKFIPSLPAPYDMPIEGTQILRPTLSDGNQQACPDNRQMMLFPPNNMLSFDIFGKSEEEQNETLMSIYTCTRNILVSYSNQFHHHTGLTSDRNQMFESFLIELLQQNESHPMRPSVVESFTKLLQVWFPEWQWNRNHGGFYSDTPNSQTIGDRLDKINENIHKYVFMVL